MRFVSPFAFKALAVYSLLTLSSVLPRPLSVADHEPVSLNITHAGPNPLENGDSAYGSLERRAPASIFRPGKGGGKDGNPPPTRPGIGRPGDDGPDPAPIRTNRSPEVKGQQFQHDFTDRLGDRPPPSANFDRYNAQMNKHSYEIDKKESINPKDPEGTYTYEVKVKDQFSPIFEAKVNHDDGGHMTVSGMYRTDGISDSIYGGIPPQDRPYISDHMAKAYAELGDGQPLSKASFDHIINDQMTNKLDDWSASKGNDFMIKEGDPEWNWVLGSELGSPLSRTVLDHPQIYGIQKPAQVRFSKNGPMWQADFDLISVPPKPNAE